MTRYLVAVTAGLFLAAAPACAHDESTLYAAEQDLWAAWDHLKAAPDDDAGHRQRAVRLLQQALEEVRAARESQALREYRGPQQEREPGDFEERQRERAQQLEEKRERREADLEERQILRDERLEEKQERRDERLEER